MALNGKRIRTLHIGLGHMGAEMVRVAARRPNLQIVGAVDMDPNKVGADLGQVVGLERSLGILVARTIKEALAKAEADITIQATGSHIPEVYDQLLQLVEGGLHVISTCEELAYPALQYPVQARELDRLAQAHGVTVLGTGINPGFIMDKLPVALTGVCQEVHSICITRAVDTVKRRLPLQKKSGAGLTVAEFEAKVQAGAIQHVGLPESVALVAKALNWVLDDVHNTTEPVVADRPLASEFIQVVPGQVSGLHQTSRGMIGGREVITMDLWMVMHIENPRDEICIEGTPPMHMVIPGGTHGDRATVAIVLNSIPIVTEAQPGVLTVLDLPVAASVGI